MHVYPIILGQEPAHTSALLGQINDFSIDDLVNTLSEADIEIIKDDFLLLARSEGSYKRCSPYQTRFLLYEFPIEARGFLTDAYIELLEREISILYENYGYHRLIWRISVAADQYSIDK